MIRHTALLISMLFASALALSGCATPIETGNADRKITPREAAQNSANALNRNVAWGGTIANATNLSNTTQLEVVGYPLGSDNRPKENSTPTGRFIVVHPGYLETADYAPGRQVTVVGNITETRSGKIGEAHYTYPVISATNLYLWPKEYQQRSSEPHFSIGIGIGVIR